MLTRLIAAGLVASAALAGPAAAETVEEFYDGKRITLVVGTGPGGGYGLYAEMLADHMPKHIPGNPTMVTQYMPGAGGATATTYIWGTAPRDGTVISSLTQSGALFQVLNPDVEYDASELSYIGRMASANAAGVIWAETGVSSLEDIKDAEIVMGATGRGDQSYMFPTLLKNLLGHQFKVVTGYPGTRDMNLAIERREIDGRVGSWTSWKAAAAEWIEDGTVVPIVEVGLVSSPDLAGKVPLVADLARDDDERAMLRLLSSYAAIGRSVSGPPEIPQERLTALRAAFEATMNDPEFQAAAAEAGVPLEYLSGEELAEIVDETVSADDALVERAKELLEY